MSILLITFLLVIGATAIVTLAYLMQRLADWWHDYTMRRKFDRIVTKAQRRYRRQ